LNGKEREPACFETGKKLKAIHDLTLDRKNSSTRSSWEEFINTQTESCFARHKKLGLTPELLRQIPDFNKNTKLSRGADDSFLHTEVMRDHVFFRTASGGPAISGFIDFEPSMTGAPEYDFASVGVFLSSGDHNALRAFFSGYGNLACADTAFRRRIMAYTLLHRYSDLKWYLEFMPQADSLEELADKWWAV
jgi:hygromycin-B 7''-O-kinase